MRRVEREEEWGARGGGTSRDGGEERGRRWSWRWQMQATVAVAVEVEVEVAAAEVGNPHICAVADAVSITHMFTETSVIVPSVRGH